jgi:hypothetical protein
LEPVWASPERFVNIVTSPWMWKCHLPWVHFGALMAISSRLNDDDYENTREGLLLQRQLQQHQHDDDELSLPSTLYHHTTSSHCQRIPNINGNKTETTTTNTPSADNLFPTTQTMVENPVSSRNSLSNSNFGPVSPPPTPLIILDSERNRFHQC